MARTRVVSTFKPTRGGDGGMPATNLAAIGAAIDRIGTRRFTYRNSAVFLSGAPRDQCLPTQDPFDRSHFERSGDRDPKLLPAAEITKSGCIVDKVHNSVPRMYAKTEYHEPAPGVLVHQEQVFDDTHERQRRLDTSEQTSPVPMRTRATIILGANLRAALRQRTRIR